MAAKNLKANQTTKVQAMPPSQKEALFRKWLRQHQHLLFKIVNAYAATVEDRDDLFQEIALQLWRALPKFRQDATAGTYIYRVALNTAISWNGKSKQYPSGKPGREADYGYVLQSQGQEIDERLAWLYEQIGQMNRIDRSVTLLLLEGFKYRDIADILGITENNVGVKITRIKQRLTKNAAKFQPHGL